MSTLNQMLDQNEQILWEGKPQLGPFVASGFPITILGMFFLGFSLFWTQTASRIGGAFGLFGVPFIVVGVSIIASPLIRFFLYQTIDYVITTKRVLIKSGLIGTDFQSVDFDKIENSMVTVGIFDKLFGANSGSIQIYTAGSFVVTNNHVYQKPHSLSNIDDPYKVFALLKQVSHDVKTDIEYPNQLRPDKNPGYQTTYKPQ